MDMTTLEINMALLRHGVKKADIARNCNVSYAAVSQVISGKMASNKIQTATAAAINMRSEQVWPSRYDKNGQPLRIKGSKAA